MTRLAVSATEANRSFSALLQKVRDGARVTITAHGKVVAEIIPPSNDQSERARRCYSRKTCIMAGPGTA
jgi:prevent-host-death family protein